MTVFVTGGAGFIGSALVIALVRDGEHVVTIDKLTYAGSRENLAEIDGASNHVFVSTDIANRSAMVALLTEHRPAAIYHLAAETHVDRSIDDPSPFIATNVAGTVSLLETTHRYWRDLADEAKKAFRFLHLSTDEVYGALGPDGLFTEESPYRPNSPYAASKAAADHLIRAWHHTYGFPILITNTSNNYGPRQFPEKLIPLSVLNAIEGRPLPIYGEGNHVRDWLHVDDHATALRLVMSRGRVGETYLIGARTERRNIGLVRALCAILDTLLPESPYRPHEKLIEHVPDRPGHDARYAIDPSKIETELDWRPRVELTAGLAETVSWYLKHLDWCAAASAKYRRERLGLRHAGKADDHVEVPEKALG